MYLFLNLTHFSLHYRPSRPNSPKNLSDTESERTGSRTQEVSSGYSSSTIESLLHRLDQSDSEMSSPDREKVGYFQAYMLEKKILMSVETTPRFDSKQKIQSFA